MFRHFVITTKTTRTRPRSSRLTVQLSVNFATRLTSSVQYRKLLPDLADYLTSIPRARMGSESIAHEAEGRMGY